MKKFLIATVVLLGSISFANAEMFRVGVSVFGGKFEADISVGMGCTRVVHITGGGKMYDCYIILPEHILKQFEQEKIAPGFKILDDFRSKDTILYPNIVLKG